MARYFDRSRFEEMDRSSLPLNQVAQFYYTTCRTEGKTAKTMRGYEEKLSRFVRWFDGPVGELTLEKAREFVAALQATEKWCEQPNKQKAGVKLSPQTVANHVRVMKAFATWLYEEGSKPENVLARLVLPRVPSRVIEVLSEEEIGRLLATVNPKDDMALRDLGILVLFLDTGLRLTNLRRSVLMLGVARQAPAISAEVLEGGAQQSRESVWAFLDKRSGQLIVRSKPGAQR